MVYVRFYSNKDYHRIRVKGHAQYAGKDDMICAGCSMLVYTLAQNIRDLEEWGSVEVMTLNIEPGNTTMDFKVKAKDWVETTNIIMESICRGYELLAAQYPQNVSYMRKNTGSNQNASLIE